VGSQPPCHYKLVVLVYALAPFASLHHILIYFFPFRNNALCLAAVCYTGSCLFHYLYGSVIFYLRLVFQEHNGVQQGLDVQGLWNYERIMCVAVSSYGYHIDHYLVYSWAVSSVRCAVTVRCD